MKYRNINVMSREDSDKLPGALDIGNSFFFLTTYEEDGTLEGLSDYDRVGNYIPENIKKDIENRIYIGDDGAVMDAYDFSELTDEEEKVAIQSVIAEKQEQYPDYELVMSPGEFPIDVWGKRFNDKETVRENQPIMSTHILYIKDYQKHLQGTNDKKL